MSNIKVRILEYSIFFSLILCLLSVFAALTVAFSKVRQVGLLHRLDLRFARSLVSEG
jgi:hypothetical protein